MALLLWLCNYRFWGAAFYTELASLKVRTEHEMVTTSTGLMESFQIRRVFFVVFFFLNENVAVYRWKRDYLIWCLSVTEIWNNMSVCVLNWNKQYFSETTFKSNVDIKPGRWIESAQCYSRKKLDFLALQINKKNQYKIIYQKNKKGIKMYMVSCSLKKSHIFYNKNINNIMDFFKIWLWYIFKIPLCIDN